MLGHSRYAVVSCAWEAGPCQPRRAAQRHVQSLWAGAPRQRLGANSEAARPAAAAQAAWSAATHRMHAHTLTRSERESTATLGGNPYYPSTEAAMLSRIVR